MRHYDPLPHASWSAWYGYKTRDTCPKHGVPFLFADTLHPYCYYREDKSSACPFAGCGWQRNREGALIHVEQPPEAKPTRIRKKPWASKRTRRRRERYEGRFGLRFELREVA